MIRLARIKLSQKILAGYLLLLVSLLFGGLFGVTSMYLKDKAYDKILKHAAHADVLRLEAAVNLEMYYLQGYLAGGDRRMLTRFEEAHQTGSRLIEDLRNGADPRVLQLLDEIAEVRQGWFEEVDRTLGLPSGERRPAGAATPGGSPVPAVDVERARLLLAGKIGVLRELEDAVRNYELGDTRRTTDFFTRVTVISLTAIFVIGLVSSISFSRSISRPLSMVVGEALAMAGGDFRKSELPVHRQDEFGELARAFETLAARVRDVVQKVAESSQRLAETSRGLLVAIEEGSRASDQVHGVAAEAARGAEEQQQGLNEVTMVVKQLSEAIEGIATGAQEQARNVHQTSLVIEQMARAIDEVAGKTQVASEATVQAAEVARRGSQAVEKTVAGMERIRNTVFTSAARIEDLGRHSQQIGEIVQVISDIADQTNLLALNAAIEAARAGEHGKGFAVVADEVRKLAERCSKATKDIANLVDTIRRGTAGAVEAMQQGTREVEEGSSLAADAGRALSEILATAERTNEQIQSISAAAQQIAASSTEMVKAMDNVASITEENTAATEEMAAGSNQVIEAVGRVAAVSGEHVRAARDIGALVDGVKEAHQDIDRQARTLARMAADLQDLIRTFRLADEDGKGGP